MSGEILSRNSTTEHQPDPREPDPKLKDKQTQSFELRGGFDWPSGKPTKTVSEPSSRKIFIREGVWYKTSIRLI